ANKNFTSSNTYNQNNWNTYEKHDYAIFNVWHTWIEYINRLFGALAGLATLFLAVLSFSYWKKTKSTTLLSWLVVFAMGFQAWLGATVVYSVLEPVKITIHMVMALVIVGMLLYLVHTTGIVSQKFTYDKGVTRLLMLALALTLVQIILGTQVRQYVDEQIDMVGETAKNLWLQHPLMQFYVHRSFSIAVVVLNGYIAYCIYRTRLGYDKIKWVLLLILLEVITGMAMYYIDFPFGTQPLHLVLASLLFGVQFYLMLEALKSRTNPKTL
ncbi:MAG: COX15/CtaA family protein, partial [Bacteroidota bacterium]